MRIFLLSLFLLVLIKRGEQRSSDLGNGLSVDECHSIVESLRANNPVLLRVHDEAAETRVLEVSLVPLWQEVAFVHSHFAGDVLLAFESHNLGEHQLLIGLGGRIDL